MEYKAPAPRCSVVLPPYDAAVYNEFGQIAHAKTNSPNTWSSYDDAIAAVVVGAAFDGVGFVLSEDDPYVGVDLDDCRDPQTDEIEDWAQRVIEDLNSYIEISPSETGVKIWVRGSIPSSVKTPSIEMYDRKRFFTVTGWHLEGTPLTINDAQDALADLHASLTGNRQSDPADDDFDEELAQQVMTSDDFLDSVSRASDDLRRLRASRRDNYGEWLDVGMALSELGAIGLGLWDNWSKSSAKYEPDACEEKWRSFNGHGMTLKSLGDSIEI
jgi:primase-polymerase (primpol)-like protein